MRKDADHARAPTDFEVQPLQRIGGINSARVGTADTANNAAHRQRRFEDLDGLGEASLKAWQRNWERSIPFFAFPAEIRKSSTPPTSWNRST